MGKSALFFILFLTAAPLIAGTLSGEGRPRFVERNYDKTEPGLRSRAEYIALAKTFLKTKYPNFPLVDYSDPWVTYRSYRNAPKADSRMICVIFPRMSSVGHGIYGGAGTFMVNQTRISLLVILMRLDLSKVYINGAS